MRVKCSNCGKTVSDVFKFCGFCGAELQKQIYCPQCEIKVDSKFKFCGKCGTKLVSYEEFKKSIGDENINKLFEKNGKNAFSGGWGTSVFHDKSL